MKKIFIFLFVLLVIGCETTTCPKLPKPVLELTHLTYNQVSLTVADTSGGLTDHLILIRHDDYPVDFYLKEGLLFIDINIQQDHIYKYVLSNYSLFAAGNTSDTLVVHVPRNPKPMEFTEAKATLIGNNAAFLEWTNNDSLVDYFAIMRDGKQIGVTQKSTFLDIELFPGQVITYRIIAVNKDGQTASYDITIETPIVILGAPKNINTERDFRSLKLSWDEIPGAINYTIESDFGAYNCMESRIEIDSLDINTLYSFIIYGNNEFGLGESATIEVKTKGQYIAIWTPNIEEDLAGYKIFNAKNEQLVSTNQDTSYIFVVGGDEFPDIEPPSVKLKAFDSAGNESGFSETAYGE